MQPKSPSIWKIAPQQSPNLNGPRKENATASGVPSWIPAPKHATAPPVYQPQQARPLEPKTSSASNMAPSAYNPFRHSPGIQTKCLHSVPPSQPVAAFAAPQAYRPSNALGIPVPQSNKTVWQPKVVPPARPMVYRGVTMPPKGISPTHQQPLPTPPGRDASTKTMSPMPIIMAGFQPAPEIIQASKNKKKKNPALEFFRDYQNKTGIDTWQNAARHYGMYVGRDQLEWLDIARALGCDLPKKVGHGKGGNDDEQGHAQEYFRGYVEFVVQAEGQRQYGTGAKKKLKQELYIA